MLQAALGLVRDVERQMVGAEVDSAQLPDRVFIKLLIGELAAQELVSLVGVVNLLIERGQIGFGDGDLDRCLRDLRIELRH